MNGLLRARLRRFLARRSAFRRHERHADIPKQAHFSYLGVVLHTQSFSCTARKRKFYELVRMRGPAGSVEGHLVRLHMHFLPGGRRWISCRAFCIRRTLQVDLHLSAASDAPAHFFVLATLRVHGVVPRPRLAKDGDLDVLQQARVLALEISHLRRFHSEDLLCSLAL